MAQAKQQTAKQKTKKTATKKTAKKKATPVKKKATPAKKKATPVKKVAKAAPAKKAKAAPAKKAKAAPAKKAAKVALPTRETLGSVTVPSGTLVVFDVGLQAYLEGAVLDAALVQVPGVPRDRALPVIGERLGLGRFGDCWDFVAVELAAGEVATEEKVGECGVDFARLLFIDAQALGAWEHRESLDGKADFLFWGRDEAKLAKAIGAPKDGEGHGWRDLPVEECIARGRAAEETKEKNGWLLATDFRPHTHDYLALAQVRATKTQSGTVEVGGGRACLFATMWGDGVFPVMIDRDARGAMLRVRVQLATEESLANMEAVN